MNIEASLHYIPEYSTRKFQMVYTKWTWIVKHYTSSSESAYWSNSNSFHMYIPKTVVSWRKIKYIHLVRKLLPSVLKVKKIDEVSNDLTSPPKYVIYKSNLALWRSVFFFLSTRSRLWAVLHLSQTHGCKVKNTNMRQTMKKTLIKGESF